MAELSKEEKNLLAVAKFYNDNLGKIEGLIYKMRMQHDIPISVIAMRTGMKPQRVAAIIHALFSHKDVPARIERKTGTARIAEKWANDPVVTNVGPTITFDTTTIAGRVAKEVYEKYIKPVSPATMLINQRAMMEEFQITKSMVTEVFGILRAKSLIREKVKGNPRQGYVTK